MTDRVREVCLTVERITARNFSNERHLLNASLMVPTQSSVCTEVCCLFFLHRQIPETNRPVQCALTSAGWQEPHRSLQEPRSPNVACLSLLSDLAV